MFCAEIAIKRILLILMTALLSSSAIAQIPQGNTPQAIQNGLRLVPFYCSLRKGDAKLRSLPTTGAVMTLSSTERRELASQMEKARELRVVQLNPTMGTEAVGRVARSFVDDARTAARSKIITLLMIVK
jgi:hypothetical protein